jgi:hypothetical protein
MGERIQRLVDQIRRAKGPFFVARLNLRVYFPLDDPNAPDKEEHILALIEVSRSLGYDPHEEPPHPPTTRKPPSR